MKNTKLFLGVLIAALVLGFASCKQEAQDVNIIGNTVKTDTVYYYTVSGTYNENSTAAADAVAGTAQVKWTVGEISNGTKYSITGTLSKKASGATTYSSMTFNGLTIYKIGGKYYEQTTDATTSAAIWLDVSSRISGNIEGTFTYTLAAGTATEGYALTFTKR